MTSRYSVPMGTSMFWGLAMASPSTVTRFVTSGMPVLRNLPSVETLVTFMMTQPTSAGRPGLPEGPTCGTSRPVQVSTSVFSALRVAHRQALDLDALHLAGQRGEQVDALGLVAFNADDAVRDLAVLHDSGDAGDDRVAALQHLAAVVGQVGSHSAALMSSVSMVLAASLTCVGKPATADTHQAAGLHGSQQAGFVGDDGRHTGRINGLRTVGLDGDSVVIAPLTMRSGAMSCTVPDTLE